jgi:hypothetical protein
MGAIEKAEPLSLRRPRPTIAAADDAEGAYRAAEGQEPTSARFFGFY